MRSLRYQIYFFILAYLLQGCASDLYYGTGIKHRSIQSCISAIEMESGSKIREYRENTPTEVSGTLANGQRFGCYFKLTGTDGMYYHGQWSAPPSNPHTEAASSDGSSFDGSRKYIVIEGGYCNVSDDCVHGLHCRHNKCESGHLRKLAPKQEPREFTSFEGQACSEYVTCATGLSCTNRVCTK